MIVFLLKRLLLLAMVVAALAYLVLSLSNREEQRSTNSQPSQTSAQNIKDDLKSGHLIEANRNINSFVSKSSGAELIQVINLEKDPKTRYNILYAALNKNTHSNISQESLINLYNNENNENMRGLILVSFGNFKADAPVLELLQKAVICDSEELSKAALSSLARFKAATKGGQIDQILNTAKAKTKNEYVKKDIETILSGRKYD